MACLVSHNDISNQEVLLTNQIGGNIAIGEQQHAFGDPQPGPQTLEAIVVTVTGDLRSIQVQQPAAMAADDQNLEDQFSRDNTAVADVEAQLSIVPNQSDPIWWLRFSGTSVLFCATMVGVLYLPGDLHEVHTTYRRAKLIASVGAPIVFAAFSIFVSFWLASDPVGNSNLIKGLLMANVSMLSGPLAIYWALTRKTEY